MLVVGLLAEGSGGAKALQQIGVHYPEVRWKKSWKIWPIMDPKYPKIARKVAPKKHVLALF
jgi:hypothetical protein